MPMTLQVALASVTSGFTVSQALPQAKAQARMLDHFAHFGASIAMEPSPL